MFDEMPQREFLHCGGSISSIFRCWLGSLVKGKDCESQFDEDVLGLWMAALSRWNSSSLSVLNTQTGLCSTSSSTIDKFYFGVNCEFTP